MNEVTETYKKMATTAIEVLQQYYCNSKGLYYEGENCSIKQYWWNSAIALETVIDYMTQTNSREYLLMIKNTFENAQSETQKPFINSYYDDNGWWAISWIKAYDFCKDDDPEMAKKYLLMADAIFQEMTGGWTSTKAECDGGIWWEKIDTSPFGKYKAAIQNELFLVVATRLHQRLSKDPLKSDYLDWANKEWNWFKETGMIADNNLIMNGLDDTQKCKCFSVDDKMIWTYNQGVILGGLVELSKINKDTSLLDQAQVIANAAITHLCYANGVLQEPCELTNTCDSNSENFKGIFMRYLSYLYSNLPDTNPNRKKYEEFIKLNAESIWVNDRNQNNIFGTKWVGGSPNAFNICTQISALDAFNAAIPFDD